MGIKKKKDDEAPEVEASVEETPAPAAEEKKAAPAKKGLPVDVPKFKVTSSYKQDKGAGSQDATNPIPDEDRVDWKAIRAAEKQGA